jgi:hypothetical protein
MDHERYAPAIAAVAKKRLNENCRQVHDVVDSFVQLRKDVSIELHQLPTIMVTG